MKVDKLTLRNFRGISDLQLELYGKSVIFYGVNGMGKSSILDAINIIFSRILSEAAKDGQIGGLMIKEKDVKLGESETEIYADILIDEDKFEYYRRRIDGKNTHSMEALRRVSERIREQYIGKWVAAQADDELPEEGEAEQLVQVDERNMPIYVYYGINRHIEGRRLLRKKYTGAAGKLDAWRDEAFDGIIDFDLFFEWFRGRQEYEYSIKIENAEFEDEQLKATRLAILQTLGEDFSAVKIKIADDNTNMIFVKKGIELSVKQLSEGEKSMTALVGDMARRLAIANPKEENPLLGEGIVLIDEVDLHLHPSWQERVMPTLMRTFPNIQFIVTTHAPKVLGEADSEIAIVKLEEEQNHIVARRINSLIGWDINTILEEYMGTNYRNEQTNQLIENMYALIEQGKYDEAEQLVNRLEKMTDSKNPAVVRARILIMKGR